MTKDTLSLVASVVGTIAMAGIVFVAFLAAVGIGIGLLVGLAILMIRAIGG